jgi:hypothetical protein
MKAKPKAKAKPKKPKQKPMSLTKRIVLASDEGKSPQEIAELLGINAQTVYSVRWQEKTRRGGNIGTEHWFHQEVAKEAKRQEQLAKAKEDWNKVFPDCAVELDVTKEEAEDLIYQLGRSKDQKQQAQTSPAVQAYSLTSFTSPPPKFTITEPHAPALLPPHTFFARVKAAYATLRGVKK